MSPLLLHVLRCAALGGVAAAGFGVLFNFGRRALLWCAAAGALALGTRTLALDAGWTMQGASLVAALIVTTLAVGPMRRWLGPAGAAIALAGCIPMVPGASLEQALLGMYALSSSSPSDPQAILVASAVSGLRVAFTLFAIGTGIAVPVQLLHARRSARGEHAGTRKHASPRHGHTPGNAHPQRSR